MVVAAPAQSTPRSASIHSTRVLEASAQRSSGRTPRSSRPAAMAKTRWDACCQLSEAQSSGPSPEAAGTG